MKHSILDQIGERQFHSLTAGVNRDRAIRNGQRQLHTPFIGKGRQACRNSLRGLPEVSHGLLACPQHICPRCGQHLLNCARKYRDIGAQLVSGLAWRQGIDARHQDRHLRAQRMARFGGMAGFRGKCCIQAIKGPLGCIYQIGDFRWPGPCRWRSGRSRTLCPGPVGGRGGVHDRERLLRARQLTEIHRAKGKLAEPQAASPSYIVMYSTTDPETKSNQLQIGACT